LRLFFSLVRVILMYPQCPFLKMHTNSLDARRKLFMRVILMYPQ
jgi:hypothetical protein